MIKPVGIFVSHLSKGQCGIRIIGPNVGPNKQGDQIMLSLTWEQANRLRDQIFDANPENYGKARNR